MAGYGYFDGLGTETESDQPVRRDEYYEPQSEFDRIFERAIRNHNANCVEGRRIPIGNRRREEDQQGPTRPHPSTRDHSTAELPHTERPMRNEIPQITHLNGIRIEGEDQFERRYAQFVRNMNADRDEDRQIARENRSRAEDQHRPPRPQSYLRDPTRPVRHEPYPRGPIDRRANQNVNNLRMDPQSVPRQRAESDTSTRHQSAQRRNEIRPENESFAQLIEREYPRAVLPPPGRGIEPSLMAARNRIDQPRRNIGPSIAELLMERPRRNELPPNAQLVAQLEEAYEEMVRAYLNVQETQNGPDATYWRDRINTIWDQYFRRSHPTLPGAARPSTGHATSPMDGRNRIDELRKANEESASLGLRFSRACLVCSVIEPKQRVVFIKCGHYVCQECADKTKNDASQGCPNCKEKGGFIPIYEEEADAPAGLRSAPFFSRACRVCFTDAPRHRAVFIRCGHVLCLACAEEMTVTARREGRAMKCPFCRGDGAFVEMKEDQENSSTVPDNE